MEGVPGLGQHSLNMTRSHRESAAKALQDVDKKSAPAKALAASKGDAVDEEKALLPQGSGSPPH